MCRLQNIGRDVDRLVRSWVATGESLDDLQPHHFAQINATSAELIAIVRRYL